MVGMTTTDEDRSKYVEKVRSLLAKAGSSEFDSEAEVFEAKAFELMAKWEIAERELVEVSDWEHGKLYDLTDFGNAGRGAASLVCRLAELFGGYGILWSIGDGKSGRARVTAKPEQMERLDLLLDHLLPQLRADLLRDRPRSRKSYSIGWSHRVDQRLKDLNRKAYAGAGALVPSNAEARGEALARYDFAIKQAKTSVDARDFNDGLAAGEVADLNQTKIGA